MADASVVYTMHLSDSALMQPVSLSHTHTHTHRGLLQAVTHKVRASPPSFNPYLRFEVTALYLCCGHGLVVTKSFKHLAEISPTSPYLSPTHTHRFVQT